MTDRKRDTATARDKNRRIRKEALREQLQAQGHVQHVFDIAKKLQDEYISLESSQISALKSAADIKLKLINKYLPDLKAVEVEGNVSNMSHEQWLASLDD